MSADRNCTICKEIDLIKTKSDPFFILELSTGYVKLGDYQYYLGYTIFVCKKHASELHELPSDFKQQFLKEMSLVAEVVFKTFKPRKLNYELLGNTAPHLHWHLFPRYQNDPLPQRPIWCIDSSITCSEKVRPSIQQVNKLKQKILKTLKTVI